MNKIFEIINEINSLLELSQSRESKSLRHAIESRKKELKKFFDKSYSRWIKKYGKMSKDYRAEIEAAKETLRHMGKNKMFKYYKGDEEDFGYQMGIIELVGDIKESAQIKEFKESKNG